MVTKIYTLGVLYALRGTGKYVPMRKIMEEGRISYSKRKLVFEHLQEFLKKGLVDAHMPPFESKHQPKRTVWKYFFRINSKGAKVFRSVKEARLSLRFNDQLANEAGGIDPGTTVVLDKRRWKFESVSAAISSDDQRELERFKHYTERGFGELLRERRGRRPKVLLDEIKLAVMKGGVFSRALTEAVADTLNLRSKAKVSFVEFERTDDVVSALLDSEIVAYAAMPYQTLVERSEELRGEIVIVPYNYVVSAKSRLAQGVEVHLVDDELYYTKSAQRSSNAEVLKRLLPRLRIYEVTNVPLDPNVSDLLSSWAKAAFVREESEQRNLKYESYSTHDSIYFVARREFFEMLSYEDLIRLLRALPNKVLKNKPIKGCKRFEHYEYEASANVMNDLEAQM